MLNYQFYLSGIEGTYGDDIEYIKFRIIYNLNNFTVLIYDPIGDTIEDDLIHEILMVLNKEFDFIFKLKPDIYYKYENTGSYVNNNIYCLLLFNEKYIKKVIESLKLPNDKTFKEGNIIRQDGENGKYIKNKKVNFDNIVEARIICHIKSFISNSKIIENNIQIEKTKNFISGLQFIDYKIFNNVIRVYEEEINSNVDSDKIEEFKKGIKLGFEKSLKRNISRISKIYETNSENEKIDVFLISQIKIFVNFIYEIKNKKDIYKIYETIKKIIMIISEDTSLKFNTYLKEYIVSKELYKNCDEFEKYIKNYIKLKYKEKNISVLFDNSNYIYSYNKNGNIIYLNYANLLHNLDNPTIVKGREIWFKNGRKIK